MGKQFCSFEKLSADPNRGGIRGIIELLILQDIEKKLGGRIPIQEFFDLIVGTR